MKTLSLATGVLFLAASAAARPADQSSTAVPPAHKSGYLQVPGGKIYYEVAGAGDWIVLVHDGNLHSVTWDDQFPVYARHYRVVRYDRRGYGKSSFPDRPYSHIEDLEEVFRQLNIDQATVMGMSAGGALSIDFTLAHPGKVARLVLVGSVVSGYEFSEHGRTRGGRLTQETRSDPAKLADYMCHRDPYTFWEGNPDARRRGYAYLMASLQNYRSDKPRSRGPARPALPILGEIKVPTLIVVGEHDLPDCHAVAGILEVSIAGSSRIVLPRAAHIVPLEQPAAFNELTLAFLKGKSFAAAAR
jgi:pimeloyl-ACP methyl ester carboxylesterase